MITQTRVGGIAGLAIAAVFCISGGCSLVAGIEEAHPVEEGPKIRVLSFDETSCNDDIVLDEDLIRGCLMRVSCDPLVPPVNLSACVSYATQSSSTREACTHKAVDCDGINDCLGREYANQDELELCDGGKRSDFTLLLCPGYRHDRLPVKRASERWSARGALTQNPQHPG